jgi:hypothetical protein
LLNNLLSPCQRALQLKYVLLDWTNSYSIWFVSWHTSYYWYWATYYSWILHTICWCHITYSCGVDYYRCNIRFQIYSFVLLFEFALPTAFSLLNLLGPLWFLTVIPCLSYTTLSWPGSICDDFSVNSLDSKNGPYYFISIVSFSRLVIFSKLPWKT